TPQAPALTGLRYRADVIGLFGDVDTLTSTSIAGTNQRTVTGATSGNLRAWAFDGSLNFETALPGTPIFTAGYAYGSGDSNPGGGGTDTAFRQTGLHGSSSRAALGRSFS